jgi:hypothetical protein
MKMRPIPLPLIIPETPSTGPSYRSDRVAAQQLAKAERRRRRKDGQAGDQEPESQDRRRPNHAPGSRFDGLA